MNIPTAKQPEAFGALTGAAALSGCGRAVPPWPGLDVERGLALWNHDMQAYQACLIGFAQRHAGTARALAHSPPCEVAALVHRLKGLAASLGLGDVAAAAVAADEALHDGCLVARHLGALQTALGVALQSISRYAAAPAGTGKPLVVTEKGRACP